MTQHTNWLKPRPSHPWTLKGQLVISSLLLLFFLSGCVPPGERRGITLPSVVQPRCEQPPAELFRSGENTQIVFIDISSMRLSDELQITYEDEVVYQCSGAASDPLTGSGDTFRIEVGSGQAELTFTNLDLEMSETVSFELNDQKYLFATFYDDAEEELTEWRVGVFDEHPGYE